MGPIYSCNPAASSFCISQLVQLGSIDLANFTIRKQRRLGSAARSDASCTRFSQRHRHLRLAAAGNPGRRFTHAPVGLGIMGFADLCLNLKVTYGSSESIDLMDEMMGFIRRESWNASIKFGAEKACFPSSNRPRSLRRFSLQPDRHLTRCETDARNYEVTTIAPTRHDLSRAETLGD